MRILLLEDDQRLREAYASRLRAEGFVVKDVSTLADAREALANTHFDCLVFDRLVADGDSMALVAEIDTMQRRPRILVVSALGDGLDRVRGLTVGADDYMVKPIHLEELALRVRNLLIRVPARSQTIPLGRVTVHRDHRQVTLDGVHVHLTPTQYAILEHLARNVGFLVTKEELIQACWDRHSRLGGNPLHSHITRLRRLFRDTLVFESTWGTGYTLHIVDAAA